MIAKAGSGVNRSIGVLRTPFDAPSGVFAAIGVLRLSVGLQDGNEHFIVGGKGMKILIFKEHIDVALSQIAQDVHVSSAFRPKRLTDFVTMMSMSPFMQAAII